MHLPKAFGPNICRPVGLKEAALDSPTFRATSTHFSEQVDLIERWLDEYLKATQRLINECSALEYLVSGFTSHAMLPDTITEAALDHDYSILAMNKFAEGAKDFWGSTIGSLKRLNAIVVVPVRTFLQNDVRAFKVSCQGLWFPANNAGREEEPGDLPEKHRQSTHQIRISLQNKGSIVP